MAHTSTSRHKMQARINGHFGGRPTNAEMELRRREREKTAKLIARKQEEAAEFLVYVMNNPNAPLPERVRCALELLNRGEFPAKSASYVGVGSMDDIDATFGVPKLVIFGKFTKNGSHAEVVDNGGAEDVSPEGPRLEERNGPETGPDVPA